MPMTIAELRAKHPLACEGGALLVAGLIEAKRILPARKWRFVGATGMTLGRFERRTSGTNTITIRSDKEQKVSASVLYGPGARHVDDMERAAKVLYLAWEKNPDMLKEYER